MCRLSEKLCKLSCLPFLTALFSLTLYRLVLPPFDGGLLVFLVPALWTALILRNESAKTENQVEPAEPIQVASDGFPARFFRFITAPFRWTTTFYGQLWSAAAIFWLVINYWLTFPHPLLIFGYLALSLYLAFYLPIYVWLVRRLNIRYRLPIAVASPLCWIAVEWLRKHIFGGYSFASLEHAFYTRPNWIQTADQFGEYTVGALVILIGTLLTMTLHALFRKKWRHAMLFGSLLVVLTGGNLLYGHRALEQCRIAEEAVRVYPAVKIALLQDPTSFTFPVSNELNLEMHQEYLRLTNEAAESKPDLIVWPESTCIDSEVTAKEGGFFPGMEKLSEQERTSKMTEYFEKKEKARSTWLKKIGTPLLLGLGSMEFKANGQSDYYNSALFLDGQGGQLRYDKCSLVMFGEYFPFIEYLPESWPVRSLCTAVKPGKGPVVIPLKTRSVPLRTIEMLPNICFESSLPHFIAQQLDELEERNIHPTVLINISNDGWFFRTWQIDFHLATHVFRAVENRKTVLTATHGGFSAAIDTGGRILTCGDRNKSGFVMAEIYPALLPRSGKVRHYVPAAVMTFVFLAALCPPFRKKRSS